MADGTPNQDAMLTPGEAAAYLLDAWNLKRGPRVLGQYRREGGGPRFYRVGNDVRYTRRLLDEWVRELIGDPVRNNSEQAARRLVAAGGEK